MLIYFIIPLVAIFSYANIIISNKEINLIFYFLIVVPVVFFSGLQFYSTIDYFGYVQNFNELPGILDLTPTYLRSLYGEPLFILFSTLLKEFSNNPQFLIFGLALISLVTKSYFYYKLSCKSLAISIYFLLDFLMVEFIQVRWGVAIGFISLFIYGYINEKRFNYLWAFAAIGFHYFSIIPIFFIIITKKLKLSIIYSTILFISLLLFILFFRNIFNIFSEFTQGIYIIEKMRIYLDNPIDKINPLLIAKSLLLFFFVFISYIRNLNLLNKIGIIFNLVSLCFTFLPIFYMRFSPLCDLVSLAVIFSKNSLNGLSYKIFLMLTPLFFFWYFADLDSLFRAGYIFNYISYLNFE